MPTLTFKGSIANLGSAIKIGNDVMRLTLEVPSSEIPNAIAATLLQGQPLKITLEVDDGTDNGTHDSEAPRKAWP